MKDATLKLSPLHALVGPNDSGKSTLLRALRTVMQVASGQFFYTRDVVTGPFVPRLAPFVDGTSLAVTWVDGAGYGVTTGNDGLKEQVSAGNNEMASLVRSLSESGALLKQSRFGEWSKRLGGAIFLRPEPDSMRTPSPLLENDEPLRFIDDAGRGLPSVLNAINTRDVDSFVELRNSVRGLFPAIRTLRTSSRREDSGAVAILEADLVTGEERVDASALSEGLLYYLAIAVMPLLAQTSVFLFEEPENGLHPARIKEVVSILREISRTKAQVSSGHTHNPLVINEGLEGSRGLARDALFKPETGTQVRVC